MRRRFMSQENRVVFDYNNYLTIEALEDNCYVVFTNDIEYGIDGMDWKLLPAHTASPAIKAGQTISFRGELDPSEYFGIGRFKISGQCNLRGNCMSMLFGDNAADNFSLNGYDYAFYELFYNCNTIENISFNFLPATTLANNCYSGMFRGCTSLKTATELPATTLKAYCYEYMFNGCTLLTTAPELPATTLVTSCYNHMFANTNILPDCSNIDFTSNTVVASGGLIGLFSGTKVTDNDLMNILPINNDGKYCLPVTMLTKECYFRMFSECELLTTAPELPATTLAGNCYERMFYRCDRLNYIKMLAVDISAYYCLNLWVFGVASTGTFVKNKDATWDVTGADGVPEGWTVQTA